MIVDLKSLDRLIHLSSVYYTVGGERN